jgi:hypothetical protein
MHLILDLDETCISSVDPNTLVPQHDKLENFNIFNPTTNKLEYVTFKRPFLNEFLQWANQNCKISIWSAGEKNYVSNVVQNLFNNNSPKLVLSRDDCNECEKITYSLKNLEWLKDKMSELDNKEQIILIDDLQDNCTSNPDDSIMIKPFNATDPNAAEDTELLKILQQFTNVHKKKKGSFWNL